MYLNRCGLTERTLLNGAARLNVTFHRPSFVMACSLCGVRGLDIPCSAHIGTGSQTCENQRSKHGASPRAAAVSPLGFVAPLRARRGRAGSRARFGYRLAQTRAEDDSVPITMPALTSLQKKSCRPG